MRTTNVSSPHTNVARSTLLGGGSRRLSLLTDGSDQDVPHVLITLSGHLGDLSGGKPISLELAEGLAPVLTLTLELFNDHLGRVLLLDREVLDRGLLDHFDDLLGDVVRTLRHCTAPML